VLARLTRVASAPTARYRATHTALLYHHDSVPRLIREDRDWGPTSVFCGHRPPLGSFNTTDAAEPRHPQEHFMQGVQRHRGDGTPVPATDYGHVGVRARTAAARSRHEQARVRRGHSHAEARRVAAVALADTLRTAAGSIPVAGGRSTPRRAAGSSQVVAGGRSRALGHTCRTPLLRGRLVAAGRSPPGHSRRHRGCTLRRRRHWEGPTPCRTWRSRA
jgi:hypothetical protein